MDRRIRELFNANSRNSRRTRSTWKVKSEKLQEKEIIMIIEIVEWNFKFHVKPVDTNTDDFPHRST